MQKCTRHLLSHRSKLRNLFTKAYKHSRRFATRATPLIPLLAAPIVPLLQKSHEEYDQVQIQTTIEEEDVVYNEDEEFSQLTFWETLKIYLRALQLVLLFCPLIVTLPILLFTEWKPFQQLWYRVFYKTLVIAGPCFIKFGQWMGTRLDLFPLELCEELRKLHNSGYIHRYKDTRKTIREAFGREIEDLFEYFEKEPFASGAIAQIYKARLKTNPEEFVAVKVRHPNVTESIKTDLYLLRKLLLFIASIPRFKWLRIDENIREFSQHMMSQVDLQIEANNLEQFRYNFRTIPNVRFPKPVQQFCHPSVLTETLEDGVPVSKFLAENYSGKTKEKRKLAKLFINLYLKMIIVDNFTHTDLHPGNILIQLNNNHQPNGRVVILDAGLVTKLSDTRKRNFLDLFTCIVNGDSKQAAELLVSRAPKTPYTPRLDTVNEAERYRIQKFTEEMSSVIDKVVHMRLKDVEVGKLLQQVLDLGRKYRIPIDSKFTALALGTIIVEGIGKQFDPDLDFVGAARPILLKSSETREKFIIGQVRKLLKDWC